MLPVLQLGPFAIQTYPLALVLAGWVALAIGARAAKRLGLDGDDIYNAGLYAFLAGIIAARFAHVIVYWPAYRAQPLEIFGFNMTAFLAWPGVLAGLAVAGLYIYRRRLPLFAMLDAFSPGLLVGMAVAALGALLAGRNAGAPADLPWAITLWGVARHPVQIYEAIGLLAVAALTWRMIQMGARRGAPFLTALLGYGLTVWFVEAFRSPEVTGTVAGGLRTAQIVGLVVALVALFGFRLVMRPPEVSADDPAVDA